MKQFAQSCCYSMNGHCVKVGLLVVLSYMCYYLWVLSLKSCHRKLCLFGDEGIRRSIVTFRSAACVRGGRGQPSQPGRHGNALSSELLHYKAL